MRLVPTGRRMCGFVGRAPVSWRKSSVALRNIPCWPAPSRAGRVARVRFDGRLNTSRPPPRRHWRATAAARNGPGLPCSPALASDRVWRNSSTLRSLVALSVACEPTETAALSYHTTGPVAAPLFRRSIRDRQMRLTTTQRLRERQERLGCFVSWRQTEVLTIPTDVSGRPAAVHGARHRKHRRRVRLRYRRDLRNTTIWSLRDRRVSA